MSFGLYLLAGVAVLEFITIGVLKHWLSEEERTTRNLLNVLGNVLDERDEWIAKYNSEIEKQRKDIYLQKQ